MSTARQSDLELIQLLVSGHRNAWRQFVLRYQGLVYARVKRTGEECQLPLRPADLEDVVAEVFAELLNDDCAPLRRFEGRSSLSTWLSVIARRVCLRHLRGRRGIDPGPGCNLDHEPASTDDDVLRQLIAREDIQRLRSCLARLQARDQELLRLFYLEKCSYEELARHFALSPNAIGPCLQRAQRRLRKILEQPAPGSSSPSAPPSAWQASRHHAP